MSDVTLTPARAGNRWINGEPSAEDFAAWFQSVWIHPGLFHDRYVGGLVLISQKEKQRVGRIGANGDPEIVDLERAVYTPYARVDTRVRYFKDYVKTLDDERSETHHFGLIEPDPSVPQHGGLPKGFFPYSVDLGNSRVAKFLGCSMVARIYERTMRTGDRGRLVDEGAPGSKIVPLVFSGYQGNVRANDNAIMNAQTGAVGRALGLLGMLIIPGSGVASAEDVQESVGGQPPGATEEALPPVEGQAQGATDEDTLRAGIKTMLSNLEPAAVERVNELAEQRHLDLSDGGQKLKPEQLRGAYRLIEKEATK